MSKGTWNYRIGTYMFSYKKAYPDNEEWWDMKDERMFCVISAYYKSKNHKKPHSYGLCKQNIMDGYETYEGLKWTNKKIKLAFKKSILDLDNFPKKFKK